MKNLPTPCKNFLNIKIYYSWKKEEEELSLHNFNIGGLTSEYEWIDASESLEGSKKTFSVLWIKSYCIFINDLPLVWYCCLSLPFFALWDFHIFIFISIHSKLMHAEVFSCKILQEL